MDKRDIRIKTPTSKVYYLRALIDLPEISLDEFIRLSPLDLIEDSDWRRVGLGALLAGRRDIFNHLKESGKLKITDSFVLKIASSYARMCAKLPLAVSEIFVNDLMLPAGYINFDNNGYIVFNKYNDLFRKSPFMSYFAGNIENAIFWSQKVNCSQKDILLQAENYVFKRTIRDKIEQKGGMGEDYVEIDKLLSIAEKLPIECRSLILLSYLIAMLLDTKGDVFDMLNNLPQERKSILLEAMGLLS